MIKGILSNANIKAAYNQVVSNKGSAGVDKMLVSDLKDYLHEHWVRISAEIESGTYQPQAIRGIEIPKSNGGKRLLGIPTVVDRMLQQSVYQVLCPMYDREFSARFMLFAPSTTNCKRFCRHWTTSMLVINTL